MSAGAQALPRRKGGSPAPWMPDWAADGNWHRTPNAVVKLYRFMSQAQMAVFGWINRESTGRGSEWTDPRQTEQAIAEDLGYHKNAVGNALYILAEAGVIEARRVGRTRRFRLANVPDWERKPAKHWESRFTAAEAAFRKSQGITDEAEDESEEESEEQAKSTEVMVRVPGHKPVALRELCPNAANCSLLQSHADGTLEQRLISIENKASSSSIETVNCLNQSPSVRPVPEVAHQGNRDEQEAKTGQEETWGEGLADFQLFLSTRLALKLGSAPPAAIVASEWRRLVDAGATLELFRHRFELREQKFRSWGFLRLLVDDIVEACAAAGKAHQAEQSTRDAHDERARDQLYAGPRRRLREACRALSKLSGYQGLVDALRSLDGRLARKEPLDEISMQLDSASALMRTIAERQTTVAMRHELDQLVAKDLKPYRERMTEAQMQRLHAQTFSRRLFEKHGLPDLSEILLS